MRDGHRRLERPDRVSRVGIYGDRYTYNTRKLAKRNSPCGDGEEPKRCPPCHQHSTLPPGRTQIFHGTGFRPSHGTTVLDLYCSQALVTSVSLPSAVQEKRNASEQIRGSETKSLIDTIFVGIGPRCNEARTRPGAGEIVLNILPNRSATSTLNLLRDRRAPGNVPCTP